jgi:hypothetical protein
MALSGIHAEQTIFDRGERLHISVLPTPIPAAEGAFSKALRGLAREIDAGERQTAAASELHSYDTGTLIALQVGIYRYTEAVDLASKIVDRATTTVRTVLQGGGH